MVVEDKQEQEIVKVGGVFELEVVTVVFFSEEVDSLGGGQGLAAVVLVSPEVGVVTLQTNISQLLPFQHLQDRVSLIPRAVHSHH